MNKFNLNFLLILLSPIWCSAQQSYWQQHVDYSIDVKLDDKNHSLSATETIVYTNNSPNVLPFLYFHIWPNAYKSNKTAFAKQLAKNNELKFQFASDKDKGFIDSLDFKVNGEKIKWYIIKDSTDICKLMLNEPLQPGKSITISTPFYVKIPSSKFSRLGHAEEQYQITQWYPKPAVYDQNGWNPMPYLNMGEFYSEYGNFNVNITLPVNYVVGATGNLQTPNEINWNNLLANSNKTGKKLADSLGLKGYKTIQFIQDSVHDFAWFCDKNYVIEKDEVRLPNSLNIVTTYSLYNKDNSDVWKGSTLYLKQAIYNYSLWNGNYPYKVVTAVDGALSAGGGMEYPTITIIGDVNTKALLDIVITHEVGHNWFYGILGSNERAHGWMDEGINSFNEFRYVNKYYKNESVLSSLGIPSSIANSLNLKTVKQNELYRLTYLSCANLNIDQAIETHSADFTKINYGAVMYMKSALIFNKLYEYLGQQVFDSCFHTYFEIWKFKHPQPNDIKQIFTQVSGKNLDWFFNDLIQTNKKIDYKIKKIDPTFNLIVKNKRNIATPFTINYYLNDSIIARQSVEGFLHLSKIKLIQTNFDKLTLDDSKTSLDINYRNNIYDNNKTFKKLVPAKLKLFNLYNAQDKINFSFIPSIGYNYYNKFMVGVLFSNAILPANKFKFLINPMYAFGTKNLVGHGRISYTFLFEKGIKNLEFGLNVKRYNVNSSGLLSPFTIANDANYLYNKIAPYIYLKLPSKEGNPFAKNELILRQNFINYNPVTSLIVISNNLVRARNPELQILQLTFNHLHNHPIDGFDFQIDFQSNRFKNSRISSTLNFSHQYLNKKYFKIRLFAGLITRTPITTNFSNQLYYFNINSYNDYLYNQDLLARAGTNAWFGNNQNHVKSDGGFRNFIYNTPNENSRFMKMKNLVSSNITWDIPKLPIALYADIGYTNAFAFNSGIQLSLFNGFAEFYFPVYTTGFASSFKYTERIRFSIYMDKLNLFKQIENILN